MLLAMSPSLLCGGDDRASRSPRGWVCLDKTALYVAAIHGAEATVALRLSRGANRDIGEKPVSACPLCALLHCS